MSSWNDKQWEIVNAALKLLFDGDVRIQREGGLFRITGVSGVPRLQALEESFAYLEDKTGQGKEIDPFERSDGTSWVILSQVLSYLGLKHVALEVASRYLSKCYDLQTHERRIHKGGPLYWASERHREIGDNDNAKGYMLLAFVEDCAGYEDPRKAPAYQRLKSVFGFSSSFLDALVDYAKGVPTFPDFPEEILLGWELAQVPRLRTTGRPD